MEDSDPVLGHQVRTVGAAQTTSDFITTEPPNLIHVAVSTVVVIVSFADKGSNVPEEVRESASGAF